MARTKQSSKRTRRTTALPLMGLAGASLSLAGGAQAAVMPAADQPLMSLFPTQTMLGEEEIADVSLSTFYVFDKENAATPALGEKLAAGCRCGCRGCGGRGCGGRGCGGRCGGCGFGGCLGCGGCGCGRCCISWGRCLWAC
jgi:hypothetical protein